MSFSVLLELGSMCKRGREEMETPERKARQVIDEMLQQAGWLVQEVARANIGAGRGIAIREFPLKSGYGFADYLLYVDQKTVGVIEAKREGTTLTGIEAQAQKYSEGLPAHLPAPVRPLPFCYQRTGVETRFTSGLDPDPRSRRVFHFYRPETLAAWFIASAQSRGTARRAPTNDQPAVREPEVLYGSTLRHCLHHLPPLATAGLWPAQIKAVQNLERSFADDRPRTLIQMATGSGKTFTAITSVYWLIKFANARRVLFLVDRANLGRQALKEFQQYVTPDDGRKFTELYNVQHMTSNKLDPVARVCITTIQRLYSMLKGEEDLDPVLEEGSQFDTAADLIREPVPMVYNPKIPIETFDVIFTDECHRSIYNLWRQVLEYFDAYLIGLTATPSKQTIGFFNQNLVMEYNHEQAVADGVNVDFDVYRIRTRITERGAQVEAGLFVDRRDRETRAVRWEKLDEDLTYDASKLDRDVVAVDQIRTVIRTFKEKLFTEIFPGRKDVPKTLIYAKDDSHADDIVQIVREEFGKGNDFAQKITYKTGTARVVTKKVGSDGQEIEEVTYKSSGLKPEDLLSSFRNSYNPRIVVTVDMIATGTDIKPLEVVMFLRAVKSRNFQIEAARTDAEGVEPTPEQVILAAQRLMKEAVAPFVTNPALRDQLTAMKQRLEQTIDTVSKDVVLEARSPRPHAREHKVWSPRSSSLSKNIKRRSLRCRCCTASRMRNVCALLTSRPWPKRLRHHPTPGRAKRFGAHTRRSISQRCVAQEVECSLTSSRWYVLPCIRKTS